MSQLDTLVDLADTTPATKSMSDSANNMDEFDPFGPTSTSNDATNNDNDNDNLLVDFTVETEEKSKQNGITENFDADYEVTMSAENEIQSEGHIYANSEPIADPIYENVGETNGKAEEDVYENVVKETGDNQEISVTIKADINTSDANALEVEALDANAAEVDTSDITAAEVDASDINTAEVAASDVNAAEVDASNVSTSEVGTSDVNTSDVNVIYDTPSSTKRQDDDNDDDDVAVVTSEDDGAPSPRYDDDVEIDNEKVLKSPSRSRSNSENRESISPAERPASPTPESEGDQQGRALSPTVSDEEAASANMGSEDDPNRDSQNLTQSPVPTPTPRKRTSLSRSKSPELEITKEHSRSPSISSEGRNTRSPSPDDMINQEEEIIKNGETVSISRENAVFTETRGDPSLSGTGVCSTETVETSKVTSEEVSTDKIHSPVASEETVQGGRVLPSRSDAGIFENEPAVLEGVARYSECKDEDKLPEQGTARNLAAGFKEIQDESVKPSVSQKRDITPERFGEKSEFVSEPRSKIETYEGKSESGIFESQPDELSESIVSGYAKNEEKLPEKGTTDNILQKLKDIQSTPVQKENQGKREITPDRSGKSEYVSEPRTSFEEYVGKPESGIFESQPVRDPNVIRPEDEEEEEILPNQGTARNLVAKFKKLQEEQPYVPKKPVDILPSNTGVEPSIVESQPISLEGVVKEGDETEEKYPEKGQTRNLLAKFREIESGGGSQSPSPRGRKEFTPPREHPRGINSGNQESGVYENTPKKGLEYQPVKIEGGIFENDPVSRPDVVKEADRFEERLPEQGTARNLLSKFKQIQNDASVKSPTSPRSMKEFTPPRDDLPTHQTGLNESGIVENEPQYRPDVLREADTDWNEGMPSKGSAKSVVDKFKCIQEEAKKESVKAMPKKPSKVRR